MRRIELTEAEYKGSGIKTLRFSGWVLLIVCIIAAVILVPLWTDERGYSNHINWDCVFYSFALVFSGISSLGLCFCIATIAENSLLKTITHEKEIEEKEKAERERLEREEEECEEED